MVQITITGGGKMVVFRTDPCGITCIITTYICVVYADYVVIRHLVVPTMSDT